MNKLQKFFSLVLMGGLLMLSLSCKDNSASPSYTSNPSINPPGNPSSNTVTMAGNAFSPVTLTVAQHSVVTWYNNSGVTHTSTSNTGKWNTGDITPGSSATITFDSLGTFSYHCIYHSGMVGTVIVQ